MTTRNPHFRNKIAKFVKDPDAYKSITHVAALPEKGETETLYKCGEYEYIFQNDEWVYFIVPVFIKPVKNEYNRPNPANLPHGTACMMLDNLDVYVVLDGCWACFPMHHFISEEVVG